MNGQRSPKIIGSEEKVTTTTTTSYGWKAGSVISHCAKFLAQCFGAEFVGCTKVLIQLLPNLICAIYS